MMPKERKKFLREKRQRLTFRKTDVHGGEKTESFERSSEEKQFKGVT